MKQLSFFELYNHDTDFPQVFKRHKVVHCLFSPTINSPEEHFFKLAVRVGTPLVFEENTQTGEIEINHWTQIKADNQLLHNDYGHLSFEMYGAYLYCVEQSKGGDEVYFVDGEKIAEVLFEKDKNLLERLKSIKVKFGLQNSDFSYNEDYILQEDELGWKINWNYESLKNDSTNKNLIDEFNQFLASNIENADFVKPLMLKPNEGVFWWDRRVLYGIKSKLGDSIWKKGAVVRNLPKEIFKKLPGIRQNPSIEGVYEPTGHLNDANKILGQFEPHVLTTVFKDLIEHFDEE